MAVKPREALKPHLSVSRLCMSNSLMELVSLFEWKMKSHSVSCSVMPNSYNPMDCNPPWNCPWNSPGKNTEVGFHLLLQGIFTTQGLNLGLFSSQADSLPQSHQGSPKIGITF